MSKFIDAYHPKEAIIREHRSSTILSWFRNPILLLLWILLCIGLSISLWITTIQTRSATDRLDAAQQKVKAEEQRGFTLIQKLNEADSNYAKEKIIRDELGLQKPGETILQVPVQQ